HHSQPGPGRFGVGPDPGGDGEAMSEPAPRSSDVERYCYSDLRLLHRVPADAPGVSRKRRTILARVRYYLARRRWRAAHRYDWDAIEKRWPSPGDPGAPVRVHPWPTEGSVWFPVDGDRL